MQKTKIFKIKIPKDLEKHVTAKIVQDMLNVRFQALGEKFKVKEVVTAYETRPK